MKRRVKTFLMAVLVGLFAVGLCVPPLTEAQSSLFRLSQVTVLVLSNTLYISLYTTGDVHRGAALWLSCRVDGQFCRPSALVAVDEPPSGWITLRKLPQDFQNPNSTNNCNKGGGRTADCHDTGIAYQWCVPVKGGREVWVDLKMATNEAGKTVFIEKGHVYIDASLIKGKNRCPQAPTTDSNEDDELAVTLGAAKETEEVADSTRPGQQ